MDKLFGKAKSHSLGPSILGQIGNFFMSDWEKKHILFGFRNGA